MELQLGNEIVGSYKRLAYEPWYAFAEFVDNSTQAYFDNQKKLDEVYLSTSSNLEIEISYIDQSHIRITDNSIGMNEGELMNALILGKPPKDTSGRSRYGLGLKTAACWLGDNWTVTTKKLGDSNTHQITFDVQKIINGDLDLNHKVIADQSLSEHYTKIEITRLHKVFKTRTLGKIKEYLTSMYRSDFNGYGLKILWQGEELEYIDLEKRKLTQDNRRWSEIIDFDIPNSNRNIKGWVSVLSDGYRGRKHAGFSIIQAGRVIQGWPRAFKPASIFGADESNDLVNQRVFGELEMKGFSVSHTKDKIVWEDDDQEYVDKMLAEVSKRAIYLAHTLRVNPSVSDDLQQQAILIGKFQTELASDEVNDFFESLSPPPDKILNSNNCSVTEAVVNDQEPDIDVEVGSGSEKINVKLYLSTNSVYEPYVVIELSIENNSVAIFINTLHPHYVEMCESETKENFIRHCVYDGISEWKAIKLIGELKPSTVKYIKDGLLRQPYEIKKQYSSS